MSNNRPASAPVRRRGPGGPHGPGGPMGTGEKAKNFKGTIIRLGGYLKPFSVVLVFISIFAIFSTVLDILGPRVLGNATNTLVDGYMLKLNGLGGIDFGKIGMILVTLIGLYLISSLFNYLQAFLMSDVAQKVTYQLRKEVSEKINRLPLRYYDTRTYGEILSRITNDIDTVSMSLSQSVTQIITSVVTIIGILIMMLSINIWMTLIALLTLPVSLILISVIVKASQKLFKKQQESLGYLNGHVEEMYGAHNVIKVFNGEERSITQFKEINNELYHSAWKSQFLSGLMMPIISLIGNIGYVCVCVLGGWLAVNGKVNIGDIQSFLQYVRRFNQPISQTANIMNILQSTAAAAERVFEFLSEEDEVPDTDHPVKLEDIRGEVTFDHVRFGYTPDKIIVKDMNVHVEPGQKIAIVGPTGAGKTTIINLLMRFYDVNEGSIRVDGVDIRDMRRDDLRNMFGMVLQDTWLFSGTIKENLSYGRQGATDEEVYEAARTAKVHHFIHTLSDGYDTVINEEASNISQGQKQLLTIARAVISDPKILILDEATSSVDTRTEILIQKAMNNLMQGRTSFIIAHRLSTIRDADLILVMKDGDIIEQGTHAQLMEMNGFYTTLYNSQFAH